MSMMDENKVKLLKKTELFSTLSKNELKQIGEILKTKKFRKSEIILHEDDTANYMYIIIEGEVKVIRATEEGKEILLAIHGPGEFFGEMSLIDGKTTPARVTATTNSRVAFLSKSDFYSLLFSQQKVLEQLLQMFCSRIRNSWKRIQLLNFKNASQRVKMLFLILSEDYGQKTDEGIVLNLKLIHQDIADMAGLTRETVTRVLDRWQKGGEIKILQNRKILLRPEFESIAF